MTRFPSCDQSCDSHCYCNADKWWPLAMRNLHQLSCEAMLIVDGPFFKIVVWFLLFKKCPGDAYFSTHMKKVSKMIKMLEWWVSHDHGYFCSIFLFIQKFTSVLQQYISKFYQYAGKFYFFYFYFFTKFTSIFQQYAGNFYNMQVNFFFFFLQNLSAYCNNTLVSFFFFFSKLTSVNSADAGKFCV